MSNLFIAWRKARKGKTKRNYVIEFEIDLIKNLLILQKELKNQTYNPLPLKTFILRDPKTRKISKSAFKDRIVHHALINIIGPIFEIIFIHDSCANRKGKGSLFALNRFEKFQRKVTHNLSKSAFCLKADIKHYFKEVNHEILLKILKERICDESVIWLIKKILSNNPWDDFVGGGGKQICGMPLGNYTSQSFANIYLNKLDYFVKHKLKIKYYIRYVDDFIIFHRSRTQLEFWKEEINKFLKEELKLELHKQKSRIILLSHGVDFVGFRNFYYHKLLRKRNIINMLYKLEKYRNKEINDKELLDVYNGWQSYAHWASSYRLRQKMISKIKSLSVLKQKTI